MTLENISIDPAVMNGQPCVRGTRLTVKRVLHILAEYKDRDEIRKDYPRLDDDAIRDALLYAAASRSRIAPKSSPTERDEDPVG
jgi:uncharacterized protein (DUF433 family)